MDDFTLLRYLQGKERSESHDGNLMHKFKNFMRREAMSKGYGRGRVRRHKDSDYYDDYLDYEDGFYMDDMYDRFSREHSHSHNFIDEQNAEHIVHNMYHTNNGMRYNGEKYSMQKAKEIIVKYKSMIPEYVSVPEMYLALNAQYHDYCALFKSWFGENIDSKIIESAIVFWFKDPDYTKGNKVQEYFKED